MKDRFEPEEWEMLTTLPFLFFVAIAMADGEIDDDEFDEFSRSILQRSTDDRDPLHREIAMELADMTYGDFLAIGPDGFCDPLTAKKVLKRRLADDEYQRFVGSLFRDALNVASAGPGAFSSWPPIGSAATDALIEMTTFWEIDLPSLLSTILGRSE